MAPVPLPPSLASAPQPSAPPPSRRAPLLSRQLPAPCALRTLASRQCSTTAWSCRLHWRRSSVLQHSVRVFLRSISVARLQSAEDERECDAVCRQRSGADSSANDTPDCNVFRSCVGLHSARLDEKSETSCREAKFCGCGGGCFCILHAPRLKCLSDSGCRGRFCCR